MDSQSPPRATLVPEAVDEREDHRRSHHEQLSPPARHRSPPRDVDRSTSPPLVQPLSPPPEPQRRYYGENDDYEQLERPRSQPSAGHTPPHTSNAPVRKELPPDTHTNLRSSRPAPSAPLPPQRKESPAEPIPRPNTGLGNAVEETQPKAPVNAPPTKRVFMVGPYQGHCNLTGR